MADQVEGARLLVELGAGTGPVTQALVDRFPDTPLVCVELQESLATQLRERFPQIEVEAKPAAVVLNGLQAAPEETTIVSALPFRSLPRDIRDETIAALVHMLNKSPKRRLVQFTYQPREPFDVSAWPQLEWSRVKTVWRNAPPAGVWCLQSKP